MGDSQLTGVFAVLATQHAEISAMVAQLTGGGARADGWPKLRAELMAHEQGELQAVYPVLRGRDDTRALAEQHDPQAAALASTMARLDILGLDSDEWRDGFAELAALLAKHVDAEEHTIFPRAQTAIGDAQAQALEAPFRDAYQQVIDSM